MAETNPPAAESARPQITLVTDGACKGNPGRGGWAALLMWNGHEKVLQGAEAETTNNRMEIMGAIEGLKAIKRPAHVTVMTDSKYLLDGITKWIHGWKKNGWKNASKAPVKNADLWQALDLAIKPHQIQWEWVKGHSGHPLNERVDALANDAIVQLLGQK